MQPYLFWRIAPSVAGKSTGPGRLNTKTYGVRWIGDLPHKVDYTMEIAGQTGSSAGEDTKAWAGFWRIGRQFDSLPLQPRLRLEFNHASGDSDPSDSRHETFDVLYPTAHDKYGLADQVGWKNVNHVGFIAEVNPIRSLVFQAKAHDWRLASARDGLYNSSGVMLLRDPSGLSGKHIGEEIDLQVLWTGGSHIAIGGGIGHLFPGSFVKRASPGNSFTFPYVQLTYRL